MSDLKRIIELAIKIKDQTGDVLDDLVDELKKLDKSAGKADKSIGKVDKSLKGMAGAVMKVAGAIATIAFPVVAAAKFERAMSEVAAISGATAEQLEKLTKVAMKMGSTTEFSAVQAAEGLKFLAMAGMSVDEQMAALPGTLKLAKAAAVELGEAADIVTNILSGFGLEVTELNRLNNVLVNTLTSTNSSLVEIGEAMKFVAPIASAVGVPLEKTASAVGLLHNAGIKSGMAGRALSMAITKAINPSKKAEKVLSKLGKRIGQTSLEMLNSQGNFIGYEDTIKALEDTGASTGDVLKIFGQIAGPKMLALMSSGSEGLQRQTDLFERQKNKINEVSDIMSDNLVGTWRSFMSAVSELSIVFGNLFIPAVESVLKLLADLVKDTSDYIKENKILVGSITAAIGVFGILVPILGKVQVAFSLAQVALVRFGATIATYISGLLTFSGAAAALTSAFATLTVAAVAFVGAMTFSETLREWVFEFDAFGAKIGDWWNVIKSHFNLGLNFIVGQFYLFYHEVVYRCTLAIGKIRSIFANFAIDVVQTLKSIPGIGKLLGWADDGLKIEETLKRMKQQAEDLSKSAEEAYKNAYKYYDDIMLASAELTLEKEKEIKAIQSLNEAREFALEIEKQTDKAVAAVIKNRLAGLNKIKKADEEAREASIAATAEYEKGIESATEAFDKFTKSTDGQIESIWNNNTGTGIIAGYEDTLTALETSTEIFGQKQLKQTEELERQISNAKIDVVLDNIKETDAIYSAQLESIKQFEYAKVDLSVYSGDERIDKEEEVAQEVRTLSLEVLTKKKESFVSARESLEAELDRSIEKEIDIANKIKGVQNEIRQSKMTTEEKVRDLKRQTMTDEEKYQDTLKEYNKQLSISHQNVGKNNELAIASGKKAQELATQLVKKTKDGVDDTSLAIKKVKEAGDAIEGGLSAREKALESSFSVTQIHSAKVKDDINSISGVIDNLTEKLSDSLFVDVQIDHQEFKRSIEDLEEKYAIKIKADLVLDNVREQLQAYEKMTEELVKEIEIEFQVTGEDALKTFLKTHSDVVTRLEKEVDAKIISDGSLDNLSNVDKHLLNMAGSLDTFQKKADSNTQVKVNSNPLDEARSKAAEIITKLNELDNMDTHSTHTIHERTVKEHATGGKIEGFERKKDKLAGYGGGDTIQALLEPGEWIIKKESVSKYGDGLMSKINAGTADIPAFATGGKVGETSEEEKAELEKQLSEVHKVVNQIGKKVSTEAVTAYGGVASGWGTYGGVYSGEKKEFYFTENDNEPSTNEVALAARATIGLNNIDPWKLYKNSVSFVLDYSESQRQGFTSEEIKRLYESINSGVGVMPIEIKGVTFLSQEETKALKKKEAEEKEAAGNNKKKKYFATGGKIHGYGGGDTVPALLEAGETIIKKESTAKYGDTFLKLLNEGKIPKFATGGKVGQGTGSGTGSSNQNFSKDFNIQISSNSRQDFDNYAKEVESSVKQHKQNIQAINKSASGQESMAAAVSNNSLLKAQENLETGITNSRRSNTIRLQGINNSFSDSERSAKDEHNKVLMGLSRGINADLVKIDSDYGKAKQNIGREYTSSYRDLYKNHNKQMVNSESQYLSDFQQINVSANNQLKNLKSNFRSSMQDEKKNHKSVLAGVEIDHSKTIEQIISGSNESRINTQEQYSEQTEDINKNHLRTLEDANEAYNESVLDAQENYQDSLSDSKESYFEDQKQIQKNHLKSLEDAENNYQESIADTIENFNESVVDSNEDYYESITDSNKDFNDSMLDAAEDYQESIADTNKDYQETIIDSNKSYKESLLDVEEDYNDLMADANEDYQEAILDSNKDYQRSIADTNKDYQKSILDSFEDFNSSMVDAEEDYQETILNSNKDYQEAILDTNKDYNKAILDAKEDLADSIADVNEDNLKAISDSNENYAKSITDAKEDLADSIEDIEEQKTENLADIAEQLAEKFIDIDKKVLEEKKAISESRLTLEKDLQRNIENIKLSAQEKIKALRQKDLSDEEKELQKSRDAYAKRNEAQTILGGDNVDLEGLEKAKKLLEESQDLFSGLSDQGKAVSGIISTSSDLINVEESKTELFQKEKTSEKKQVDIDTGTEKDLATEDAADQDQDVSDDANKQISKAKEAHNEKLADMAIEQAQVLADLEEQLQENLADLEEGHAEKLADMDEAQAEKLADMAEDKAKADADREEDKVKADADREEKQLEKLSDIEEAQAENLADMAEAQAEKLADMAEDKAKADTDREEAQAEKLADMAEDKAKADVDREEQHAENLADMAEAQAEKLADMEEAQAEKLADMAEDKAKADADREEQLVEKLADIAEEHEKTIVNINLRKQEELIAAKEVNIERLADIEEQHLERLADMEEEKIKASDASEKQKQRALADLDEELQKALADLESRKQKALADADETKLANINSANAAHSQIITNMNDQYKKSVTDIGTLRGKKTLSLGVEHAEAINELDARVLAEKNALKTIKDEKKLNLDNETIENKNVLTNRLNDALATEKARHDNVLSNINAEKILQPGGSGGSNRKGFASGGFIDQGSGSEDDVPALLMKGEYVQNKDAVEKYGKNFMDMVNNQTLPKDILKINKNMNNPLSIPISSNTGTSSNISEQFLNFNINNNDVGKLKGDSMTINNLINELQKAQMST